MKKHTLSLGAAVIVAGLAGCTALQPDFSRHNDYAPEEIPVAKAKPQPEQSINKRPVEFVDGVYIGRKTVPLATDKVLPPVFSSPQKYSVTLVVNRGRVNVNGLAEWVTRTTGIPVSVAPNVLLTGSSTTNLATANSPGNTLTPVSNPSGVAPLFSLPPSAQGSGPLPPNLAGMMEDGPLKAAQTLPGMPEGFPIESSMTLDYRGPLSTFLDIASARLGISWEYMDGRIHLYRYKSRTFEIKAVGGVKTLTTSYSSSGNVSGGGGGGSGGSGGSSSGGSTGGSSSTTALSQSHTANLNFWADLENQLKSMISPGGKVAFNQAASTVTVTDTPQVLQSAEALIADANRRVSRSIYLRVELVTISDIMDNGKNFDISAVLTSSNGKFRLLSTGIPSVSQLGGGIGTFVLAPGAASVPSATAGGYTPGRQGDNIANAQGSNAIIQALSRVTKVLDRTGVDALTINNQPVPVTMATSQSYIDSIGSTSTTTSTSTTATQATISYGVFLELLPKVLDNNQLLLQYTVDISNLEALEAANTGNNPSGIVVRSPKIPRTSTTQVARVRPGETIVLSQLAQNRDSDQEAGGLTGFSNAKSKNRKTTLVFITPVLIDSET
ncbi:type IVB pilus formation outer membrane protein, R64 PilN family [Noviherbaspirillum humi]|uniref:Type IVB pilus formation outer membrane protein, R64 PilN family n=1 Tax=Noviherbaspirillum humi TaxID=1688639 RepID=A0A239KVG3_9BURK|nr:secretin N-terminal domain-containing protein [Noviherbaspirillum humi]SNT21990.1 type IVB pilus formation outer membrane protein, R64 PilN family [Noviherbaspirillum humi]